MKKILFILGFLFLASIPALAQDDDNDNDGGERIRDKMTEYIQKRLDLSRDEAEKFSPVFIRYFKEWRQAIRQNRGDKLLLQQKIVELRIRYRSHFREIMGDNRGNQVFKHQDIFIRELKGIRNDRQHNNPNRINRRVNRLY